MFRKLTQTFTATHFVILAIAAMFIPGTLYAVVSYQPVAIVNANTGYKAAVDNSGRLYTYDPVLDPIALYSKNPQNFVAIQYLGNHDTTCHQVSYTLPAGKSLVVTRVSGTFVNVASSSASNLGFYLEAGSGCDVSDDRAYHYATVPAGAVAPVDVELTPGAPIPGGTAPYIYDNFSGELIIQGYLVPSTAVPSAAPSVAGGPRKR